ncbi:MAG: MerC domain-containing protein [Asticcacaulis sp.]|nr:MerC domain-containing protein [Asticcacaulis sp.]
MTLSGLCVVHCVALPLLVAILPVLGIFSQNDIVHKVLVLIAVPLSALALWRSNGWRKTDIAVLMGTGLFLLALAAFLPSLDAFEALISVFGALMVAAAHGLNYTGVRPFHRHTADCACDA